jgi:hypothetical protein
VRARLILASTVLTLSAAGTLAASAAAPPPPVSVTVGPDGVCVTISLQVPQCVPLSSVTKVQSAQRLPIGVPYQNGNEICWDPTPTSKGACVPLD